LIGGIQPALAEIDQESGEIELEILLSQLALLIPKYSGE
jgi:hypothetical protein